MPSPSHKEKIMETDKSKLHAQFYNSTLIFQNAVHRRGRGTFSSIMNVTLKSIFTFPTKTSGFWILCLHSLTAFTRKDQGGCPSKNCYTVVITPSVPTTLPNPKHTWEHCLLHAPKTPRGRNDSTCRKNSETEKQTISTMLVISRALIALSLAVSRLPVFYTCCFSPPTPQSG